MTYLAPGRLNHGNLKARNQFGRIILPLFCSVILLGALYGCVQTQPEPRQDGAPEVTASPPQDMSREAQIAFYHLSLNEAADKGDAETALNALDALIKIAPAPELYIRRAIMFNQAGQRDKSLAVIREGALKYTDDYSLHIVWAEILEQFGRHDQALVVLDGFTKRYYALPAAKRRERKNEINGIRQFSVYILLNGRRFDEAAAYIGAVPQKELTPTLLFYEVILLRNQGQQRLATTKLYELVKNYPDFTDGWLTLASDMEKEGNYKGALRFYNKALEQSPVTEIYLRMLSTQIKAGDVRGAQNQVISAPLSAEVKLQAAVIFMDAKEYQAARAILLTLQQDPFAADDTAMYLSMIAYDTGENVTEALGRLQDISPDAPNRARMLYLKALLHIRANNYPSALETARTLRDDYPENKDHWSFLAEMANVSKKHKLAESVCREALEQWPEDVPIMYSLAMSLTMQKKNGPAILLLEDILILDEANVMAMNALAYTLAEEKRDLRRALVLGRKALSREPSNSSIMDTVAWVYYQMGNHEEAWKMIKGCVAKGVEDAVIWEHYGDIALARGDKLAARAGYARALELKPDNSSDIRKKYRNIK